MAAWQCNPDTNIHSFKISYIKLSTQILVIPGLALMKQSFPELLSFFEQQNFIESSELQKDGSHTMKLAALFIV